MKEILRWCCLLSCLGALADSAASSDREVNTFREWRSDKRVESPLYYFKWWAAGKVKRHLQLHGSGQNASFLEVNRARVTAQRIQALLKQKQADVCPQTSLLEEHNDWQIHESFQGSDGVTHAVMRSAKGGLRYVAILSDKVIHADPEPCSAGGVSLVQKPKSTQMDNAAEEQPLNVKKDPLVRDCRKLVRRTAKKRCGKDFYINMVSSSVQVIDGFAVKAIMQIVKDGKKTLHDPECDFEVPWSPDASLLQKATEGARRRRRRAGAMGSASGRRRTRRRKAAADGKSPSGSGRRRATAGGESPSASGRRRSRRRRSDALAEEKMGLQATLRMHVDICDADLKDSVVDPNAALMLQYGLGYLPGYKGYEHWEDEALAKVPFFATSLLDVQVPASYDMATDRPDCFPRDGAEVVRNQGQCGSCWAFGSATALMNNICVKGDPGQREHVFSSSSDRFEVSVQGIMSCQANGCGGGGSVSADSAFKKYGIGRERDFPYRCGGGRAEDHFDIPNVNCTAPSNRIRDGWGAKCQFTRNPAWLYSGISRAYIPGQYPSMALNQASPAAEKNVAIMKKMLLECGSGAVNFNVHQNFYSYKQGVYDTVEGRKSGSHLVAMVGYGTEGGKRYWRLQNSWGARWGDNGFFKMIQGINLAGIDNGIYVCYSAKINGNAPPPTPGLPKKPLAPTPPPQRPPAPTPPRATKVPSATEKPEPGRGGKGAPGPSPVPVPVPSTPGRGGKGAPGPSPVPVPVPLTPGRGGKGGKGA